MSVCRITHQFCRKSVPWALQHAKGLAEDQIAHDIKYEPLTPMCRIPLSVPALVISQLLRMAVCSLAKHLAPNPHIREDVLLQGFDCGIAKSVAHDSSLARMLRLVNGRVYADCFGRAWECFVEAPLSYVGTETVNCLQTSRCVDGKQVGAKAYIWPILDMCAVQRKMAATFVRIVGEIDVCDLCKKRAGVFREWMESQSIDNDCKNLHGVSRRSPLFGNSTNVESERPKNGRNEK
jgi:hypothetical protein